MKIPGWPKDVLELRQIPTYRLGLMQAKAYRALQAGFGRILDERGLTLSEWALLGLLVQESNLRQTDLAEELGVKAPQISASLKSLAERRLIERVRSTGDHRERRVALTPTGRMLVEETEVLVRAEFRSLLDHIPRPELIAYVSVVKRLSRLL